MKIFRMVCTLFSLAIFISPGFSQSLSSRNQIPSEDSQSLQPTAASPEKAKIKPKKVWTNDEISTAGGEGAISVVGNAPAHDTRLSSNEHSRKSASTSVSDRQVASYRDRLRQLHNEIETTDKKISEIRNFKADNSSPSGGINMHQRYSTTPLEDQVKTLEAKKKQLQAQIESIEDQARKSGIQPGQLR